jgi:hypothetical protein
MDAFEAARLRMQCLELAARVAGASASGFYSVISDAKKYWEFVESHPTGVAPAKPSDADDDIPF